MRNIGYFDELLIRQYSFYSRNNIIKGNCCNASQV